MHLEQIKSDIYDLYDECLVNLSPFHRKLDLFIVPAYLVEKVLNATGIDIHGHWVCIDNFGILHTLEQLRTVSSTKKKKVSRVVFHTMYKMKATK